MNPAHPGADTSPPRKPDGALFVIDLFERWFPNEELPIWQQCKFRLANVTPAVKLCERLSFRACCALQQLRSGAAAKFWLHSASDEAALFRAIEALQLPTAQRESLYGLANDGTSRATCLGITVGKLGRPYVPKITSQHKLIIRLAIKTLRATYPSCQVTALQLTHNCRAGMHVDPNNARDSFALQLGPCFGGELWEYNPSTKQTTIHARGE